MTIITILLTIFFIFASSIKVLGWQHFIFETQLTFFKKYGLNRLHMFIIGLVELSAAMFLVSAIILDSSIFNTIGALIIAVTSIGAIYFHVKFDTIKDAIPAICTLLLSTTLVFSSKLFLGLLT